MLGIKTKASGKTKVKAEKRTCGQRPKGLGGPICTRKVRAGWDTCGRPDCVDWKFAESA